MIRQTKDALRRGVCAVGVAAAGLFAPGVADAYSESVDSIGEWSVLFTEVESGLKICSLARLYESGEWILLDRAVDGQDLMTIYSPRAPALDKTRAVAPIQLRLSDGEEGGAEALVDVSDPGRPLELNGLEGVMMTIDEETLQALRGAADVSVRYGGFGTPSLPLDDFSGALAAVEGCARDYF